MMMPLSAACLARGIKASFPGCPIIAIASTPNPTDSLSCLTIFSKSHSEYRISASAPVSLIAFIAPAATIPANPPASGPPA